MRNLLRSVSLVFSAGCFGGLANSLTLWLLGVSGVTEAFQVKLAPVLTAPWLYPRIVWGGMWGFLFLLPVLKKTTLLRGLLFSLCPTVVQLFVIFPLKAKKGIMGFELGNLTPAFVVVLNAVWGGFAAYWLKYSGEHR